MDPFKFGDDRVLVTGGSSGIGRATAVCLSQMGAKVLLVGRDVTRLEEVRKALSGAGHAVFVLDLAGSVDLGPWMRDVVAQAGRLSGLVHAAGMQATLPIRAMSLNKWNELLHINTTVAFLLAKAFRQKDVRSPAASIVFLSSIMAHVGQPALAAYSASKGALEAMTRSLALEFAAEGIRVNAVAPGHVQTPMADKLAATIGEKGMEALRTAHPLGFGTADDVACAITYLLSPAARWVTGTTLTIDGGYLAR